MRGLRRKQSWHFAVPSFYHSFVRFKISPVAFAHAQSLAFEPKAGNHWISRLITFLVFFRGMGTGTMLSEALLGFCIVFVPLVAEQGGSQFPSPLCSESGPYYVMPSRFLCMALVPMPPSAELGGNASPFSSWRSLKVFLAEDEGACLKPRCPWFKDNGCKEHDF